MGPISITRSIDAPRERVFDFICDLANRPAFTDHFIGQFRLERLESKGVGASARMRIRRRHLWMETVLVEATSPYRIPVTTGWELVDLPGGRGCEVKLSFWTQPSGLVDRLREGLRAERFYRR